MSFTGLLNQTLTIYPKTSYNAQGREVVGAGVDTKARVQETSKRRMLPNGNLITIDLVAYVPPDTTVETDYRADYSGQKYKVWSKYAAVKGNGATHHLKLELVKWRET